MGYELHFRLPFQQPFFPEEGKEEIAITGDTSMKELSGDEVDQKLAAGDKLVPVAYDALTHKYIFARFADLEKTVFSELSTGEKREILQAVNRFLAPEETHKKQMAEKVTKCLQKAVWNIGTLGPVLEKAVASVHMHEALPHILSAVRDRNYSHLYDICKKFGSPDEMKAILKEAINILGKQNELPQAAYLNRLMSAFEAIVNFPHERHKLTPLESLKIAVFAENQLAKGGTEAVYIKKEESTLARDIILDMKSHTFFILSKKHGKLKAEGTFKKVTDAVAVTFQQHAATGLFAHAEASHFIRAKNKEGKSFDKREINLERKYGDAILVVTHVGTKGKHKTNLIQIAYDGDLVKMGKTLSRPQELSVLSTVGQKLEQMHGDDHVHNDLKDANILVKKLPDGSVRAKVADFGLTYYRTDMSWRFRDTYGTSTFTSPEKVLQQGMLADPITQGKAEDMYAFGCVMLEMLQKKHIAWGDPVSNFVTARHKTGSGDQNVAAKGIEMQIKAYNDLRQVANSFPPTQDSRLAAICAGLLDPNPATRLTARQFNQLLATIS